MWGARKIYEMSLPSGATRKVRRPSPELALVVGKVQRTLKATVNALGGKSREEKADEFLVQMNAEQEKATMALSV